MKTMTRFSTSKWNLTCPGFSSVLDKTDQTSHSKVDYGILERHIVVVEQTVCLLRTLQDSSSNIGADDKEHLENLSSAFYDVSSALRQCFALASSSPTTIANDICLKVKSDGVSKPAFDISLLEDFLSLGCSYTIISEMLGCLVGLYQIERKIMAWKTLNRSVIYLTTSLTKLYEVLYVNREQQITFLDTTVF